ncbi:MAG TPA: outer membrane beta-barrel protein [Flavipsychrobacter sp.]|jgi:hypothetical protein|nr:outer membrane beta-barrel protein [Flavipsychrobacter sp.]
MKKFILAILAVGAVATAQAQKPGSILIYGDAGFSTNKTTNDDGLPGTSDVIYKQNMWNVSPGVGYQINKMLTLGVNLDISGAKNSMEMGPATGEQRVREIGVGLFARMTMPVSKRIFLFDQLNVSYLTGKETFESTGLSDQENAYKGFGAAWFPAVGVNITHCLALNFSFGGLGYAQRTWDKNNDPGSASYLAVGETKESAFAITFGHQFNIGISANLGGRRMRGHAEPGMDRRHMDTNDDEDAPKSNSSSDVDE